MRPVTSQDGRAIGVRSHLLTGPEGRICQAKVKGMVRTPVIRADLGTPAERDQAAARRHCTPGAIGKQLEARLLRVLH